MLQVHLYFIPYIIIIRLSRHSLRSLFSGESTYIIDIGTYACSSSSRNTHAKPRVLPLALYKIPVELS